MSIFSIFRFLEWHPDREKIAQAIWAEEFPNLSYEDRSVGVLCCYVLRLYVQQASAARIIVCPASQSVVGVAPDTHSVEIEIFGQNPLRESKVKRLFLVSPNETIYLHPTGSEPPTWLEDGTISGGVYVGVTRDYTAIPVEWGWPLVDMAAKACLTPETFPEFHVENGILCIRNGQDPYRMAFNQCDSEYMPEYVVQSLCTCAEKLRLPYLLNERGFQLL